MIKGGQYAWIDGVPTMIGWNISQELSSAQQVTSNSQLGSYRRNGVCKWSGSFNGLGGKPADILLPRSSFNGIFWTGPDSGVITGTGQAFEGVTKVSKLEINWDFSSDTPLTYSCDFLGHLALTEDATQAAITDTTDPTLHPHCVTKLELTDVAVAGVKSMKLTISAAVTEYNNSDTIVSGKCWTGVELGAIDWEAQVVVENDRFQFAAGTDYVLKMYTSATEYWELEWGKHLGHSDIKADRKTNEIIGYTMNFGMNGNIDNTFANQGKIQLPGAASAWWPTVLNS